MDTHRIDLPAVVFPDEAVNARDRFAIREEEIRRNRGARASRQHGTELDALCPAQFGMIAPGEFRISFDIESALEAVRDVSIRPRVIGGAKGIHLGEDDFVKLVRRAMCTTRMPPPLRKGSCSAESERAENQGDFCAASRAHGAGEFARRRR